MFDPTSKKVCICRFTIRGGFQSRVVDHSNFWSWSTQYEVVGRTYRYYIDFFVNDLANPRLRVRLRNQQTSHDLDSTAKVVAHLTGFTAEVLAVAKITFVGS
jgi:hypothetical protein